MISKRFRLIAVLLAGVLSAFLSGPAFAQSKKKVIRLQEITVEGRIQKPQAFYILPRTNLDYEALDGAESFLPEITKSVEKEPF